MCEGEGFLEDCILALRTFLAQSPLLATVSVDASYSSRRVSSLLSTFTSASIRTYKLEVPGCSTDLKLLIASATPLLLPRMIHFECTSSQYHGPMTIKFIQSLLDVIKSRWHVERREVAKLRSVRLCFECVVIVEGAEELFSMMDCLRVLKAEGLDIVVFQSCNDGLTRQQLL
ncbi:hypothetical protein CPB85DRAFT_1272465 [Mucidula mucida]|nr:hypothetical protein CPB85DRAFT_1272465 [Mucidula mucida]